MYITFSFIYMQIVGVGILGLAIFVFTNKGYLLTIVGDIAGSANFDVAGVLNATSYLENALYILVTTGCIITVIGFCGLCGGIRESKCLLYLVS